MIRTPGGQTTGRKGWGVRVPQSGVRLDVTRCLAGWPVDGAEVDVCAVAVPPAADERTRGAMVFDHVAHQIVLAPASASARRPERIPGGSRKKSLRGTRRTPPWWTYT